MRVSGADTAGQEIKRPGYFFKAVINDQAVAFFPRTIEHCMIKQYGLSYEHDSRGNALAAVITNGRMEIRGHRAFSVDRVNSIVKTMLALPELECLKDFQVQYLGAKQ